VDELHGVPTQQQRRSRPPSRDDASVLAIRLAPITNLS